MTTNESGATFQVSHRGKDGRVTTINHIQCPVDGAMLRAVDVEIMPDGGLEWPCPCCHLNMLDHKPDSNPK
jgi:hypothetical protein